MFPIIMAHRLKFNRQIIGNVAGFSENSATIIGDRKYFVIFLDLLVNHKRKMQRQLVTPVRISIVLKKFQKDLTVQLCVTNFWGRQRAIFNQTYAVVPDFLKFPEATYPHREILHSQNCPKFFSFHYKLHSSIFLNLYLQAIYNKRQPKKLKKILEKQSPEKIFRLFQFLVRSGAWNLMRRRFLPVRLFRSCIFRNEPQMKMTT